MEIFITKVCTEVSNVITCEYGGVIPYSSILLFLTLIFGIFFYSSFKITQKIL